MACICCKATPSGCTMVNLCTPIWTPVAFLLLVLVVPISSLRVVAPQRVASILGHKSIQIRTQPQLRHLSAVHSVPEDITDGVSLLPLVLIGKDALHLKHSIATWLDQEYIPQAIHHKLGGHVETQYCALRKEGIHDLGELLIRLGTALEKVDMEDAFVNAWDVANKAADLLITRLDEAATVQCYNTVDNILSRDSIHNAIRELESEFTRYTLLKDYLDGDAPYSQVHTALALQLGFRLPERTLFEKVDTSHATSPVSLQQYDDLAPVGWENLSSVPDFSAVEDVALAEKIKGDLPEDETSSDLIIESMLGLEYYTTLKQQNDPSVLRRVLVTKWMYVQGFLNNVFPPLERFVPFHRLNAED